VLEGPPAEDEYGEAAAAERYAEAEAPAEEEGAEAEEQPEREEAPVALTPRELAADARYRATGKRKTAVARVTLKPGSGSYIVNGSSLEDFFPRHALQKTARQPLLAAGYERNMDVVARLHGGGVSAQAGALRHGIARALAEADPALRGEMKRRGYLTRDARAKERKKAGLKKARKRPQFSKR
jgi:small subunit ribosomal protein S9